MRLGHKKKVEEIRVGYGRVDEDLMSFPIARITVKLKKGRIHPQLHVLMVMTTEAGRFSFYAVRRGRVPGIYRSWEECEHQVNGFRNNEHRGFHDLSEALAWLRSAASPPARRPTPHAQPVRRRPSRLLEGTFCSLPSSQKVSSVLMAVDNLDFGDGSGGSNPTGEINMNDERVLFGFTVVLPYNSRGIDLVAHGPLCYEKRVARQEVSFTMLDKILGAIGYSIHDYNDRILGRLKERLNQSRDDEGDVRGIGCMPDHVMHGSDGDMKNKGKATLLNVGGPHMTSKDESGVEEAKQMPTVTEEVFSTSDDPIIDVFNKVREILLGSDGATRSIVETQAEEIKKLKCTVDGHGTLLEILWSEYAKGQERPLTHQEKYGSTKGIAVHDTKKQKKESHRKSKLACEDVDTVAVTNDVDAIIAKIGAGMNAVNTNLDHAKNSDYKKGTMPASHSSTVKQ
ncbi:hypothetical protein Ahy_B03g064034 [Arachis hypogaea]|uniref:ribonuclease H n=1 Tax=Arachis hypogaea TaxID=3818 RepID=A0A444ZYM7_ARAHY|nr:hypothetical protein Ahy_B03g064034 [Arachis hypogaea]